MAGYLCYCFIVNILRLCGTAPGTIRVLQEDTILHGYQVPANVRVNHIEFYLSNIISQLCRTMCVCMCAYVCVHILCMHVVVDLGIFIGFM